MTAGGTLKRVKSSTLLSRDGAQGMMSGDDARRRDRRRIGDAWSGKGEASRDAVVVRSGGKLTMGPWQGVLTA